MPVTNSVVFQVAIAVTGTPQQLPATFLQVGGTLTAGPSNTANISVGPSPTVSATTGYLLAKGASVPFNGISTNQLWVVGTAADVICFLGN